MLTTFSGDKFGPAAWVHDAARSAARRQSVHQGIAGRARARGRRTLRTPPSERSSYRHSSGAVKPPGRKMLRPASRSGRQPSTAHSTWGIAGVPGGPALDLQQSSLAYAHALHAAGKLYMAPACIQFWGLQRTTAITSTVARPVCAASGRRPSPGRRTGWRSSPGMTSSEGLLHQPDRRSKRLSERESYRRIAHPLRHAELFPQPRGNGGTSCGTSSTGTSREFPPPSPGTSCSTSTEPNLSRWTHPHRRSSNIYGPAADRIYITANLTGSSHARGAKRRQEYDQAVGRRQPRR